MPPNDDIVQRIVVQAVDEASPVLAGMNAKFQQATSSIANLGSTATEALAGAEAAAKKFGATQQELKQVEDVINSLAKRATQSKFSFQELATNYDAARASARTMAAATAATTAEVAKGTAAVKAHGESHLVTAGSVRHLGQALREVGLGPLAEVVRLLGGVGVHFGVLAGSIAAVAGGTALLVEFAHKAIESAEALERLHDATKIDIESLSTLQYAFGATGTSVKDYETALNALVKTSENAIHWNEKLAESQQSVARAQIAYLRAAAAARGEKPDPSLIQFYERQAASAAAAAAKEKLLVAQANELGAVYKRLNEILAGTKHSFDALTTTQSQVQAVGKMLREAGLSVSDLGTNLHTMGDKAKEALYKFADLLKNMDPAKARELGKALGIPPDAIESFRKGSAALKAAEDEAKRLGLVLSKENVEALHELMAAWNQLSNLVGAAMRKIGALAAPAFTEFLNGAKKLLADIVAIFETDLPLDQKIKLALQRVGVALKGLGPIFMEAFQLVVPVLVQVGIVLGQGLIIGIGMAIKEFAGQAISGGIGNAILAAGGFIRSAVWTIVVQPWIDAWNYLKGLATPAWNKLVETAKEAWAGFKQGITDWIVQPFKDAWNALVTWFDNNIVQPILKLLNLIKQGALDAWKALKGMLGAGGGDTGGGLPVASGGYIMGPGTSTSDSIPAWLSTGEFVMRAAAVQAYGLRAMYAINSMQAPRFAGGGLVTSIPRLASGGPTPSLTGQRVLNLSIEGRSFQGLQVPERTAQSLERFAVHSQIASTGRKPSWRR